MIYILCQDQLLCTNCGMLVDLNQDYFINPKLQITMAQLVFTISTAPSILIPSIQVRKRCTKKPL